MRYCRLQGVCATAAGDLTQCGNGSFGPDRSPLRSRGGSALISRAWAVHSRAETVGHPSIRPTGRRSSAWRAVRTSAPAPAISASPISTSIAGGHARDLRDVHRDSPGSGRTSSGVGAPGLREPVPASEPGGQAVHKIAQRLARDVQASSRSEGGPSSAAPG